MIICPQKLGVDFLVPSVQFGLHARDALAILVEANHRLGLNDAADDSLRILALNYPDYHGFDEEGNLVLEQAIQNRQRSWVNVMTFGLLDRPDVPPPIQIKRQTNAAS